MRSSGKGNTGERGQVLIIVVVLFSAVILTVVLGSIAPLVRQIQIGSDFQFSQQSYYAADAGSEDAYYRIRNNLPFSSPNTLLVGGATASTTVSAIDFSNEEIVSRGDARNLIRTVVKELTVVDGFDFNFALHAGVGGLYMFNNSSVNGNVYSNGVVIGSDSNHNIVRGSVVSVGSGGYVSGIRATSSVYAHVIKNSIVDDDAYYHDFGGATSSVTVGGIQYPGSADQSPIAMPISDDLIGQWEADAAAGGSVTCGSNGSYAILSSATIGPKKIPCNLTINGNGVVVTLTGTLWITGNIIINGSGGSGVQLKVADSIGNKSVAVIAHNPANPANSGTVTINGNSNFYGSSGNTDSYVMMISQNASAEGGGSVVAINVVNGAAGNLLTYAPHGQIQLANNVNLREVTAYKLKLINNTVVNYAIGLAQTLFTSGSGGSWKIKRWKESP